MHLPRDGVEYARITITNLPTAATVEASLDRETWNPVEKVNSELVYLLRGPDSDSEDGYVVSVTKTPFWVRVTGTPEVVIRQAGIIYLD